MQNRIAPKLPDDIEDLCIGINLILCGAYRPLSQLEKHHLKNTGHALYFALLLLADYVNLEEAETDFSDFLSNCDANI